MCAIRFTTHEDAYAYWCHLSLSLFSVNNTFHFLGSYNFVVLGG